MRCAVVDANLLILLLVGQTLGAARVATNRRTRDFGPGSYTALLDLLSDFDTITVTPHSLAEVSNLLPVQESAEGERLQESLLILIGSVIEVYDTAKRLVVEKEIRWLGLSDVAQLLAVEKHGILLTANRKLHVAALQRGVQSVDFREYMDLRV
jgi:hypothetical protein